MRWFVPIVPLLIAFSFHLSQSEESSATPTEIVIPPEIESHLSRLRDVSFGTRRTAYRELKQVMESHHEDAQWRDWIRRQIEQEIHPHAQSLLLGVEQQVFGADITLMDSLAEETENLKSQESPLESTSFGPILNALRGEIFGSLGDDPPIRKPLVRDQEIESAFRKIQQSGLKGFPGSWPLDSDEQPTDDEIMDFSKKYLSVREFLTDALNRGAGFGYGLIPVFFSMGEKADIDSIVSNLPDSWDVIFSDLPPLFSLLHRKGTLDLMESIGMDRSPRFDISRFRSSGNLRNSVMNWWEKEKVAVGYDQNRRRNMTPLRFLGLFERLVHIIPLDSEGRVVWMTNDFNMDWNKFEVGCFDFKSEESIVLVEGGHHGYANPTYTFPTLDLTRPLPGWPIEDFRWNAETRQIELDSGGLRIGIRFDTVNGIAVHEEAIDVSTSEYSSPQTEHQFQMNHYQEFEDIVYELRGGDLFRVDEANETETCLHDFGYILSFYLSEDRKKAVIVEREFLAPALWLVNLE